jgi:hypothetical protein
MSNEKRLELRASAPTDFHVDVDGVGHFIFARRTIRDEMRIGAEYSRFIEGVEQPTSFLDSMAGWISTLNVLTVEAPHNWNPEGMDPFDEDTHEKILKVYGALRTKEGEFRRQKAARSAGENSGPGTGAAPELLVSPAVPPAAE